MRAVDSSYDEEHAGGSLRQEELLAILELREELEGCRVQDKARDILAQTQRTRREILGRISMAFRSHDLDSVRHEIDRLKFYENVIEAAEARLESLEQ